MNVALRPQPGTLNLISLCTGGGGLDLGLELACPQARSVVLVEREAFAVAGLVAAMREGLLADAPVWSDVGTFDGRPWRGLVDGVIGGIPCQPHSLAGKRLGEADERDLWSDARRIIVQSGAWFVVIENVEGMLTSGGAERVVRDLQRLGFAVEIGLFSASETGASHQRNRVFILAVADGARVGFGRWPGSESGEPAGRGRPDTDDDGFVLADAKCSGCEDLAGLSAQGWQSNPCDGGCTLADADVNDYGRPDRPRSVCCAAAAAERETRKPDGEWRRTRSGDGRADMADAGGAGLAIGQQPAIGRGALRHEGPAVGADGGAMDDAARLGDRPVPVQQGQPRRSGADIAGPVPGNAGLAEGILGLFPPGPSDLDGWRSVLEDSPQLEPAVRRMADGVAARLDLAGPHAARIERLRLLGNGVVPLEAAYAIRTLATRLAARGAAGAARLVLMMEPA